MSGLLRPADVFVDVGANWGYFSLAAAHSVGPRGRVVAFEPEPRLYRMLVTNIAANEIAWIEAHPSPLPPVTGACRLPPFGEDAGNWGDSRAVIHAGATRFRVRDARPRCRTRHRGRRQRAARQDRRRRQRSPGACRDAEGAGCRQVDYVLLECHPALLAERGESAHGCVGALLTAGYRVWTVAHSAEAHRRAASGDLAAANLLEPYAPGAVLGDWPHVMAARLERGTLPDASRIRQRVRSTRRLRSDAAADRRGIADLQAGLGLHLVVPGTGPLGARAADARHACQRPADAGIAGADGRVRAQRARPGATGGVRLARAALEPARIRAAAARSPVCDSAPDDRSHQRVQGTCALVPYAGRWRARRCGTCTSTSASAR